MPASFFTVYRTASWDTGFLLWSPTHLGWLAASVVFLAVLLPLYRRAGERDRTKNCRRGLFGDGDTGIIAERISTVCLPSVCFDPGGLYRILEEAYEVRDRTEQYTV